MTTGNPLAGPWEFKWLQEIVACDNCKTKNRLRHGKPRPGCGKCKFPLTNARSVPPSRIVVPKFSPVTDGGRQFLQLVKDGHMSFESRLFEEAVRDYDAAVHCGMAGKVLEVEDIGPLMAEIYYHRGVCYFGLHRFPEAAESFRIAIPAMRFEPQFYLGYLASLERAGRLERSVLALRGVLGADTPPSVRKALAPSYVPTEVPGSPLALSGFWYALAQVDPGLESLARDF